MSAGHKGTEKPTKESVQRACRNTATSADYCCDAHWEEVYKNCDWLSLSNTVLLKQGVPTRRLTDSMTSRKTSFFLYLMPSDLQETALVTVAGGRGAPVSNLCPSWVMYLRDKNVNTEAKYRKKKGKSTVCSRAFPESIKGKQRVSWLLREDCLTDCSSLNSGGNPELACYMSASTTVL